MARRRRYGDVLVLRKKHDNVLYDISTETKRLGAALHIIAEREDMGYFFPPDPLDPDEVHMYTDEEIAALPEEFRDTAIKKNARAVAVFRAYEEEVAQHKLVNMALEGDGEAAWELLEMRRGYEYEGYSTEDLIVCDARGNIVKE